MKDKKCRNRKFKNCLKDLADENDSEKTRGKRKNDKVHKKTEGILLGSNALTTAPSGHLA